MLVSTPKGSETLRNMRDGFEAWFASVTWNIQGSDELVNLVDEIELNLSECLGGYLSKQQLKMENDSGLSCPRFTIV